MYSVSYKQKIITTISQLNFFFLFLSYKIFDFKSRNCTFYKAIEKRGDVSSMQLICMTKERKQILPAKTERYETKINR